MRLALLLLLFASMPAAAGLCGPATDYVQMKDQAANPESRKRLVVYYCMHKMMFEGARKTGGMSMRDMGECATEMTKAKDALTAAGATEALAQTNDCERVLPKPKG